MTTLYVILKPRFIDLKYLDYVWGLNSVRSWLLILVNESSGEVEFRWHNYNYLSTAYKSISIIIWWHTHDAIIYVAGYVIANKTNAVHCIIGIYFLSNR